MGLDSHGPPPFSIANNPEGLTFHSLANGTSLTLGYRILRVTNPASFQALPMFQAIIDYASQAELDESLVFMRQPGKVKEGAHGQLIELVTDFKVSFTADV